MPSRVLDVQEALKPIEENDFTLVVHAPIRRS
jgi:hypothetical protein